MNKILSRLTLLLCVSIVVSCSEEKEEPPTSITLSPEGRIMHHGETLQLTATPNRGVSFISENKNIASVNSSGLVQAVLIGKTRIVASAGSAVAYCEIDVRPKVINLPEPLLLFGRNIDEVRKLFDATYPSAQYEIIEEEGAFARSFPNYKIEKQRIPLYVIYRSDDNGNLISVTYRTLAWRNLLKEYTRERYLSTNKMVKDKYEFLSVDERIQVLVSAHAGDHHDATFLHGPRP